MRIYLFFLISILSAASCSSPVPKGIIAPENMYSTVKDIMMADEFINNNLMKDSGVNIKQRRSVLYAQVFELHHTNRNQFYKSFTYYQQHPKLLKLVFDSLAVGLKKEEYKKMPLGTKDSLLQ